MTLALARLVEAFAAGAVIGSVALIFIAALVGFAILVVWVANRWVDGRSGF